MQNKINISYDNKHRNPIPRDKYTHLIKPKLPTQNQKSQLSAEKY